VLGFSLREGSETRVDETLEKMNRLVGKKVGIIKQIDEMPQDTDDFVVFQYSALSSNISRFSPRAKTNDGGGKGASRNGAVAVAIGEVVERYCCGMYHQNDLLSARYGEVKDQAVSLEHFALFSDEQYQRNPKLARISSDTRLNWVTGYSLTEERPILVPACFVFVPYKFTAVEDHIVWEANSTGAAAGSSLEEAVLSGIYEVVERDAIMIMWLNMLFMPRVDLLTSRNPALLDFVTKSALFNLELFVNNITTDIEIPVLFGLCVDKMGNEPIVTVGAAADLNPERALARTLEEAAQGRVIMKSRVKQHSNYSFDGDFGQIMDLDSHPLLYAKVDLRSEIKFLTGPPLAVIGMDEIPNKSSPNVLKNIMLCVDILREKEKEVIVVDITTPDIREVGLSVVKVIIPGMQPINGDYNHRYLGGRRTYKVPRILGYTDREVKVEELNRLPHPFP